MATTHPLITRLECAWIRRSRHRFGGRSAVALLGGAPTPVVQNTHQAEGSRIVAIGSPGVDEPLAIDYH